jgi:alkylation response protein AidB-like acyl-CoA dehydrogenase
MTTQEHEMLHYELVQPELPNQYLADDLLRHVLEHRFKVPLDIVNDLIRFGERVSGSGDLLKFAADVEQHQPYLLPPHNAFGKPHTPTRLVVHPSWRSLHYVAAEEHLVGYPYRNSHLSYGRIVQFAKLILFHASSGLYTCPLAMTDGAACVLSDILHKRNQELWDENVDLKEVEQALEYLTTSDRTSFWTSGQWMTEKLGGSDVSRATKTNAEWDGQAKKWRLYGVKWFTSATDADMTLTLARCSPNEAPSLFLVKAKAEEAAGRIKILKLKSKLGTKQLPTAELYLSGCFATKLSKNGRGIPAIGSMLNVTRLYNCASAVSYMRRIVNLARDYATKRVAFEKKLIQHDLHVRTLAGIEVETRAATLFTLRVAELLGKRDQSRLSKEEKVLIRLLTPVCKLFTAKQAVRVISEGIECFGGQGYMEDSGIPYMLRDGQVLPIWEGTTNVLSLDVFRMINKGRGVFVKAFYNECMKKIGASVSSLDGSKEVVRLGGELKASISNLCETLEEDLIEMLARDFSIRIGEQYSAVLLLEQAAQSQSKVDKAAFLKWMTDRNSFAKYSLTDPSAFKDGPSKALDTLLGKLSNISKI